MVVAISLLLLFGCEEEEILEQEDGGLENQTRAASLCNLKEFGAEYISSGIGEPGFSEDVATSVSNSAIGKVNSASIGFLRSSLYVLSGLSKGEDAAAKMSAILGSTGANAILGSLRAVPYMGVALDFIKMFVELSGDACDNTGAVASFVRDSISVAYNELQQRNWDQDDENAMDELEDISIATEDVIFSDQSLLNQMDFINNELIDSATISSYKTLFENGMLDLASNIIAYKNRMENKLTRTEAARWVLVSAVAYAHLVQWYLASAKAHLVSTRGLDIEQYKSKHQCGNPNTKDVAECLKVSAMQANAGLQYATFRNVVDQLSQVANRIYDASAKTSAYKVVYNCPEGTCWSIGSLNNSTWKIPLKNGEVMQYLWNKHLMTYSKSQQYELDYTTVMNLVPGDLRRYVPTTKKYCNYRGQQRPCHFDTDTAWPGHFVKKPTGIKNSYTYEWVPYNKYLGKGKEGFWRYLLAPKSQGGLDLLSAYYELRDSQISSSSNKIKSLIAATKSEYSNLKGILARIQYGVNRCTDDNKFSSLMNCNYLKDPVMDAMKREMKYSNKPQTPYTGTNTMLPGIIQAENYDKGGNGVAYYDTTTGNQSSTFRKDEGVDTIWEVVGTKGENVVSGITPGEWLEYTTNISPGVYNISLTYRASKQNSNKGIVIYVDGENLGWVRQDGTTGWTTKTIVSRKNIAGGNKKMVRVLSTGDGYLIDKIQFSKVSNLTPG